MANKLLWTEIRWKECENKISKLQRQIVEAYKTERIRADKVEKLQILLISSFAGRALAVRQVTSNSGRNTPGIDGVTWTTNEEKMCAIYYLKEATPGRYLAKPVRWVKIPKDNKSMRPLGIPTMFDRSVQALYNLVLQPIAEATADSSSFGFRPGKSTMDAVNAFVYQLKSKYAPRMVYEGDIQQFFSTISHDWILKNIPLPTSILQQFLKAGFMMDGLLTSTEEGVPQGGIISPTISNMTLDGLDVMLTTSIKTAWSSSVQKSFKIVRYADKFVITGAESIKIRWLWTDKVLPALTQFMETRGVKLHPVKSKLTSMYKDSVIFLGFEIRLEYFQGYRRFFVYPAHKNILSIIRKVRNVMQSLELSPGQVIEVLNPILRGWGQYYSQVSATEAFAKVDYVVWLAYLHWLKKKFPRTPVKKLVRNHFEKVGKSLIPVGSVVKDGKTIGVKLFRLTTIKVKARKRTKNSVK